MASACSAKLASALTMRVSAGGQRSTADPAGAVSSCLLSRVILHSALLVGCAAEGLVCSGGWNEYFKDALKITSEGVGKSWFNIKMKAR